MTPESSDQHDHFIRAIKDNDVTGIINSLSSDVFDVNFRDVTHDLETPLMRLCHSEVSDEDMDAILKAVGDRNPDVNLQDAVGRTLAMHACIALRHQIVVFSLAQGCDASTCDRMGRSAYHYAAESGSDWIMASLLKQTDALGCIKVLDFKGYSPTDLARHRKAYSVVKMISQAMSGGSDNQESNPRPLNPKPLQPAFMRTTPAPNVNQINNTKSPSKKQLKQVTFNPQLELNKNNRMLSSLTPIQSSNNDPSMTHNNSSLQFKNKNNLSKLNRSKDNFDDDGFSRIDNSNIEEDVISNRKVVEDTTRHSFDDNNGDNNDDNNGNDLMTQKQQTFTNLSPLKNTSCKQNPDKLTGFTSSTPMGLIKPRPLPRLLANEIKDTTTTTTPRDTMQQDNSRNNDVTTSSVLDTNPQAMDTTNNTPEPIQNDSPRKSAQNPNNNNIFTLRPTQSSLPSNRARLLAQEHQNRTTESPLPLPGSELKSKTALGDPVCNPPSTPRSSQRHKISLDISTTPPGAGLTSSSNTTKSPTSSPRHLGPVVSPRKNPPPNFNGQRNVDELLLNTSNIYSELKAKYKSSKSDNESNRTTSSSKENGHQESTSSSARNETPDPSQKNPERNILENTTTNRQGVSSSRSTTDENRLTKIRRNLPCRISTEGRRDLQAILSPVPTHRPLLQKRKPKDSIQDQCQALRGSYVVEDKHKENNNDNVFEEEIFLKSDNGSLKLGSIKRKEEKEEDEEEINRSSSRLTIRRSSLSLPDLRDMTRCLVTSQKEKSRAAKGLVETSNNVKDDAGNSTSDISKDKKQENNSSETNYDDKMLHDNEDEDKAEMEGDKSDDYDDDDVDEIGSELVDDNHKHKNIMSSPKPPSKGIERNTKGGNKETPLPSIQITTESNISSFPYKTRGITVPWN